MNFYDEYDYNALFDFLADPANGVGLPCHHNAFGNGLFPFCGHGYNAETDELTCIFPQKDNPRTCWLLAAQYLMGRSRAPSARLEPDEKAKQADAIERVIMRAMVDKAATALGLSQCRMDNNERGWLVTAEQIASFGKL